MADAAPSVRARRAHGRSSSLRRVRSVILAVTSRREVSLHASSSRAESSPMLMRLYSNLSATASPWSMLQPTVKIVGVAQLANRILAGRRFLFRHSTTPLLLDPVSNPPWRLPDFAGEVCRRPLVPARPIRALAPHPSSFARALVCGRAAELVLPCS
ncbi:uncharacterized protein LOC100274070 [Zea mays]|uniref:Uncharacterized protein n=1 Tax=Zea mays TaxID=4577 RepID=B4FYX1_MAIZE|nr:uncharacterized protein LOC100274070 [Zea mays]ACF87314.1 unknown [Zea mays]|eukprot:NP_001141921.1 uncharacterized protein LOC100274070 [Zea mays]